MALVEAGTPSHQTTPDLPQADFVDPDVERYIKKYPHLTPGGVSATLAAFDQSVARGATVTKYLGILRDRRVRDLAQQTQPHVEVSISTDQANLGLLAQAQASLASHHP